MDPQQQQGGGGGCSSPSSSGGNFICRQNSSTSTTTSTRWTPTSEQIRILKELYYNNGVRSPSADQIQRISASLRQYGKIEGKNVFYWFQNHKARERQKKKFTPPPPMHHQLHINHTNSFKECETSVAGRQNLRTNMGFGGDPYYYYTGRANSIIRSTIDLTNDDHQLKVRYKQDDHEDDDDDDNDNEAAAPEIETLPLFPIKSNGFCNFNGNYSYQSGDENGVAACASLELSLNSHMGISPD